MRSFDRLGAGFVAAAIALGVSSPRDAAAWYFPEHAELTRLALRDFAPEFVGDELDGVLLDARALGFKVCAGADMRLDAAPTEPNEACVPYGALAALAADHASDWQELARHLSVPTRRAWPLPDRPLGLLLSEAAAATWRNFQEEAPIDVLRVWSMDVARLPGALQAPPTALGSRDYVRTLDFALFAIDRGYVHRAGNAKTHFHDGTSDVTAAQARARRGDVDNALGQLLAHHMRSLQLAVYSWFQTGRTRQAYRVEALLEHAFALHFMEDALAAGHVVTDPGVVVDEKRKQRHDYFNRQGLALTRAATGRRCSELDAGSEHDVGLSPCWTAHGDGYATAVDRLYVGEAAARLQTAFARALQSGPSEPDIEQQLSSTECRAWVEGTGEPAIGCDIAWEAMLLDPQPGWARRACNRLPEEADELSNAAWARGVVAGFRDALPLLARRPLLPKANAGQATPQAHVVDPELLRWPLGAHGVCENYDDNEQSRLWRPVLMAWPEAQADVTTLQGADAFARGMNLQVLTGLALSLSDPWRDSRSLSSWGGVGAGLAFNAEGVFPYRKTRALVELNAGVSVGYLVAGQGPTFRTLGVTELRVPLTTGFCYLAGWLFRTRAPLSLVGDRFAIGLFGARAYWALDAEGTRINGWDAEVINIVLGSGGQATAAAQSGLLDNELRFRVGVRANDTAQALPDFLGDVFTFSTELNSGYFTSVLR